MKSPLVIANWKLHGNKNILFNFIKKIINKINKIKKCQLAIAPPLLYLEFLKNLILNKKIFLAAQNVDKNINGPFTGEISAEMLKDIGVKYVIIGHSERRKFHNETNELVSKKFFSIKSSNLIPVICVGETYKDKQNGITEKVCIAQIDLIYQKYGILAFKNTIIAYEPLWSIGTGISAKSKDIKHISKYIKNYFLDKNENIGKNIHIIYGGSVNEKNTKEILLIPNIDGLLVGSASLKEETLSSIIEIANSIIK